MKVWLNDEAMDLPEPLMISQALNQWPQIQGTFALALNNAFVPRSAFDQTPLNEGDRLVIITPMQGG